MRLSRLLLLLPLLVPAAVRADMLTIQTRNLEDAQLGVHYQRQLIATGGTNTYVWRSVSDLPAGLELSADGIVSGAPTQAGEFQFLVEVTSGSQTADASVTLSVVDPFPLSVGTTSLPPGFVGKPYSQQLQATGGVAPFSWSVVEGTLPAGLSVVQPDLITGTPQERDPAEGAALFTVQVQDSRGATATASLRISVKPDMPFNIDTETLPDCIVGQPYSQNITASGGATPYTFTVEGLPAGLLATKADDSTETIAGTATDANLFSLLITAQDLDQRVAVKQLYLNCTAGSLKIATQELPEAQVGKVYAVTLVSNPDSATWSLLQGDLPAGLSLSAEGVITGMPLATGSADTTATFVVAASRNGSQGIQALSIEVLDPSIQTTTPPVKGGCCAASDAGGLFPGLLAMLLLLQRGRKACT